MGERPAAYQIRDVAFCEVCAEQRPGEWDVVSGYVEFVCDACGSSTGTGQQR